MNIANFIQWFINKFIEISGFMLGKLGQINIYQNVSLLDFIITITIISAFIGIVITAPELGVAKRGTSLSDRQARRRRKEENKKKND